MAFERAGLAGSGGDGLVIAQLLHECKKTVKLFILKADQYSSDFEHYLGQIDAKIEKVYISDSKEFNIENSDLIIDCLFGTGLSREVTVLAAKLIDAMNQSGLPIVSIDIPSGLFSDDCKNTDGAIIRATTTLSFMQYKRSFLFPESAEFVGNIKLIDIDLHPSYTAACSWSMLEETDLIIEKKNPFNHKGNNGKSLIIGGLDQMNGAAILASRAATASGSGYVYCASEESTKNALLIQQAEIINLGLDQIETFSVDAVGIGVGLGMSSLALETLKKVLQFKQALVIDADAINLLAKHKDLQNILPEQSILTPHPKELKRLLGAQNDDNILERQRKFSQEHQVFILQKGKFSKITTPDGDIIVNPTGNVAMGTAGMGDVLTGLITSLLAQGYSPLKAVCYGCYLHGKAADELVYHHNFFSLTASQIIAQLPKTIANFVV